MENTSTKPKIYLLAGKTRYEVRNCMIEYFEKKFPEFEFVTYEKCYPGGNGYNKALDLALIDSCHFIIALSNDENILSFGKGVHSQINLTFNSKGPHNGIVYAMDFSNGRFDKEPLIFLHKYNYKPEIDESDYQYHASIYSWDYKNIQTVFLRDLLSNYIKDSLRGELITSPVRENEFDSHINSKASNDNLDSMRNSNTRVYNSNKKKLLYYVTHVKRGISSRKG